MASDAQPVVVSDSQAEIQAAEHLKKCGRCGEMYIHKNKGRCKLKKVHAILEYNSLGVQVYVPARKQKHEELSKNTLNADVPKLLTNSATEYDQRTNHDQFEKKSVWLDEIDLKDKYINKPEQLKNIMETADTMVHPLSKATLYEDFDFVRTEREGHQILSEGRKEQSQETKAKKAKVKKEPADQQLAPAHAPEEVSKFKPLTDKQKRVLQELKQSVLQQKMSPWRQASRRQRIRSTLITFRAKLSRLQSQIITGSRRPSTASRWRWKKVGRASLQISRATSRKRVNLAMRARHGSTCTRNKLTESLVRS